MLKRIAKIQLMGRNGLPPMSQRLEYCENQSHCDAEPVICELHPTSLVNQSGTPRELLKLGIGTDLFE